MKICWLFWASPSLLSFLTFYLVNISSGPKFSLGIWYPRADIHLVKSLKVILKVSQNYTYQIRAVLCLSADVAQKSQDQRQCISTCKCPWFQHWFCSRNDVILPNSFCIINFCLIKFSIVKVSLINIWFYQNLLFQIHWYHNQ